MKKKKSNKINHNSVKINNYNKNVNSKVDNI